MKKNVFSGIVWGTLVGAEILLGITIFRLNMLPDIYLYPILAGLILAALLIALLLFKRKTNNQEGSTRHSRRILGYILAAFLIVVCLGGTHVLSQIHKTISEVTTLPEETDVVNVFVRSEDPAQSIDEAKDYRFAVTDAFGWESTQIMLHTLETHFGHPLNLSCYTSVPEMCSALLSGEVDAMILNTTYLGILETLEEYADFHEITRVLAEHSIEATIPVTAPKDNNPENDVSPTEAPELKEPSVEEPFIVYLSGIDTRSNKLRVSNSDVNILAIVNPQSKQILLVNTPRDYYLPNPAGKNSKDKLTHHGVYGIQNPMESLGTLYEADVTYYAQINFTGFEKLIDAIGGVDVESVSGFYLEDETYVRKGMNHFNGKQALDFSRNRRSVPGGDNGRGKNQMRMITGIINKLTSSSTIITKYADIMDSLKGMIHTNFTHEDISTLAKMQLSDMAAWNVEIYAVTGTGGSNANYSLGGRHAYVMYPDEETVAHAVTLIDRVIAGETLTEDDMQLPE